MSLGIRWVALFCAVVCLGGGPLSRAANSPTSQPNVAAEQVELFDAMKSGAVKVEFIPKDAKAANVLIHNNTKKPLTIKLPEAFAGVPVLAQNLNRQNNNNNNGGGQQGLGGGFGGQQGGGGGGGQQGGFFNLAPEKQVKLEVVCVCLDHGKADPTPRMKYEILPLASYTQKPGVAELCSALGRGLVDQRAAQAAAWHLNNDMSWETLARKELKRIVGGSEPYFSQEELARAALASKTVLEQAKQKPAVASPSAQTSASTK